MSYDLLHVGYNVRTMQNYVTIKALEQLPL
jgi:hypothetical protein